MKNKKLFKKILTSIILIFCFAIVPLFVSACTLDVVAVNPDSKYVTNIELTTSNEEGDVYTITYSDGTTSTFTLKNGKDGKDGKDGEDGHNGQRGEDGEDVSIAEIYAKYVEEYGEISYADFLKEYLTINQTDNSRIISNCLQSCLKVYTEFCVTQQVISGFQIQTVNKVSVMCGSAVIYKIETDYTYVMTNYHVVYNANANEDNGTTKIAKRVVGYLYGSESTPVDSGTKDAKDYTIYNYGDYGIELEYIGGSINHDIALLKVPTSNILAVNPNVKAVKFADEYHVGQTAIAIGNPENEGISATEGIVSVDNEYIALAIDGTARNYRSIRIDTSIYGGSSGGGLFNGKGELIGITNAGNKEDQNINYAIPLHIVKNAVANIMDNYDGTNISSVKKPIIGITVSAKNSKYVYDSNLGYGNIEEDVVIEEIVENSIAEQIGLQVNDKVQSISINGYEYAVNRNFDIGDILLNLRVGDTMIVKCLRGDTIQTSQAHIFTAAEIQ